MLSLFLAKRFFLKGDVNNENRRKASAPAIVIATAGIAIGLAVMLISVCIVRGFQNEIRNKLAGFTSHIEIVDQRIYSSPENYPLITDQALIQQVSRIPAVKHVQRFSQKLGIFKTNDNFAGIALKGIGEEYDVSFLKSYLIAGKIPQIKKGESSNQIVISNSLAKLLKLKVGDKVYSYFFSETIKQRRFTIAGIYDTHIPQFDKTFVLTDIYTVNKLNDWTENQSNGLEVKLKSYDDLQTAQSALVHQIGGKADQNGNPYSVISIKENPRTISMLSWLDLLDVNVLVILIIMVIVGGFTMVSGLLILILERTRTIGILKALGATNTRIRHTFLWFASFIISRGLVIGNAIAFLLIVLQYWFHIIHLDPETYYVDAVPVEIHLGWILAVNLFALVITILSLVIPSFLISRIQPAKAIQFD